MQLFVTATCHTSLEARNQEIALYKPGRVQLILSLRYSMK